MLNIRQLTNQVEIAFWIYAIHVMRESSLIQAVLRWIYGLHDKVVMKSILQRLIAMAFAGWLAGFVIGIITVLVGPD